jgi:hypothetical protein
MPRLARAPERYLRFPDNRFLPPLLATLGGIPQSIVDSGRRPICT